LQKNPKKIGGISFFSNLHQHISKCIKLWKTALGNLTLILSCGIGTHRFQKLSRSYTPGWDCFKSLDTFYLKGFVNFKFSQRF
jgi:hypothetical protein